MLVLVQSIVSNGLAVGAVYALIGITYNVMFSASRVFSFTAGSVGMLGGVFGAIFIGQMGMPVDHRLSADPGARRHSRRGHRVRDGASRSQEPGSASLRAVYARGRADDPAADGDLLQHGCRAVPARHSDRVRILRPEVLAADPGLHRDDRRAGIPLPPHVDWACLSRDRGGQLRGARARPSRAKACASRATRSPA